MPPKKPKAGSVPAADPQPPAKAAESFPEALIADVSDAVYRDRLGPVGVANVLADPKGGDAALRSRSFSYNSITRSYLRVLKAKGLLK